mmetsp:Transcript_45364/g.141848  ORF Transcript_45364/g.141848 Transcript_45364/m.141848 type:complete len:288 (-) Transcript_45364:274-1137(-)
MVNGGMVDDRARPLHGLTRAARRELSPPAGGVARRSPPLHHALHRADCAGRRALARRSHRACRAWAAHPPAPRRAPYRLRRRAAAAERSATRHPRRGGRGRSRHARARRRRRLHPRRALRRRRRRLPAVRGRPVAAGAAPAALLARLRSAAERRRAGDAGAVHSRRRERAGDGHERGDALGLRVGAGGWHPKDGLLRVGTAEQGAAPLHGLHAVALLRGRATPRRKLARAAQRHTHRRRARGVRRRQLARRPCARAGGGVPHPAREAALGGRRPAAPARDEWRHGLR